MLNLMLAGQIEPESSDNYVERVSIPGQITDKTITLFSGQEVPVITITNIRGMYGWKVNGLIDIILNRVNIPNILTIILDDCIGRKTT